MTTHEELEHMTFAELAQHFGVRRPKPGTTKREFIDRCLVATTQAAVKPVQRDKDGTIRELDVPMNIVIGRALPAIVIRHPDGLDTTWTPLGKGRWREDIHGFDAREMQGGPDATWDGTTLAFTYLTDNWGHPTYFDPATPPEESDGTANEE